MQRECWGVRSSKERRGPARRRAPQYGNVVWSSARSHHFRDIVARLGSVPWSQAGTSGTIMKGGGVKGDAEAAAIYVGLYSRLQYLYGRGVLTTMSHSAAKPQWSELTESVFHSVWLNGKSTFAVCHLLVTDRVFPQDPRCRRGEGSELLWGGGGGTHLSQPLTTVSYRVDPPLPCAHGSVCRHG